MKSALISKIECSSSKIPWQKLRTASPRRFFQARANMRHVRVYHIKYRSRALIIAGYIVEPRRKKGKYPCIIWNRGGSRDYGALKLGKCYADLGSLARQGYIVIASQYSGGTGSEGKDDWGGENIKDVLVLESILKKYPGADSKRIGMIGFSRGGMMTYRALSLVKWIKAGVIVSGCTDEVSAPRFRKGWREHQISLYGSSKKEQIKRSALYWPEKIFKKTPLLILHGASDWRVRAGDAIRLADKLYEQKVPFRLVVYEGADHGLSEVKGESEKLIYDWFERFLKKSEKLPNSKPHGI